MTIEWNRVTWYSKFLAVILFVAVFALAFYLGEQYASIKSTQSGQLPEVYTPDVIVSSTNEVTLHVGQTGRVGNVDITLNEIAGDSRCPVDVQCIWAGEVNMRLILKSGEHTETKDIGSSQAPYVFGPHQISITDILPQKGSDAIASGDYRITFRIIDVQS